MIMLWGYEAGRHFPSERHIPQKGGGMADLYSTGTRLQWHRSSMYHYFALTAAEAYLSVSGAYRTMPPGPSYSDRQSKQIYLISLIKTNRRCFDAEKLVTL
eukprot:SAG31_NODE_6438_length_2018_cov_3.883325_2_plen_101_part_00